MGEGKQSHPKPENTSVMDVFRVFGWGGKWVGNEAITQNPVRNDWVSWVLGVGNVWGKVNEVTQSQKTCL